MVRQRRLSREEWTEAALRVMGDRGVGGIAVEPLAKALGTTKGSFYWHFRDREDLITATLERWETEETEAVIATLDPVADARSRLHQLLEAVFITYADTPDRSIALAADAGHPAVADVLARVTDRRIRYVADQLVAAGVETAEARQRALLAYTSYLGYSTLRRSAPSAVPQGPAAQAFLDSMVRLLTGSGTAS